MSKDPWNMPTQDLMLKDAHKRVAHYREQASALREMAARAGTDPLASDLRDLAGKYDALANSVSR